MASTITPAQLYRELATGVVSEVLDVRNRDEFAAGPIEGPRPTLTRNVPVYEAYDDLRGLAASTQQDAVIVCGQGNGSELLVDELADLGVRARSLEGGTEAWARFIAPVRVVGLRGAVRVWQFQRPAKGCLSYVVGVPGERCIVVDPARHSTPYIDLVEANGMRVSDVVDTHLHADHLSGGPALAERVGATYHLPPEDVSGDLPFPNRPLRDGDRIDLGGAVVRAIAMHLPGHTPGTTALLVSGQLLLVGDTVFVRGLGRPDLTGQAEELARSLFASVHEKLARLAPETIIAPAHWSTAEEFNSDGLVLTTIGQVFESTLLNEQAQEAFVEQIVHSLPTAPDSYDTIRLVNSGQIGLPGGELDVLDLGKNQCAAASTLASR